MVPLGDGQRNHRLELDGGCREDIIAHGAIYAPAEGLHIAVPGVMERRLQLVEAPYCHVEEISHANMPIVTLCAPAVLVPQCCQHPVGVLIRHAGEALQVGEGLERVLSVCRADMHHGADGSTGIVNELGQLLTLGQGELVDALHSAQDDTINRRLVEGGEGLMGDGRAECAQQQLLIQLADGRQQVVMLQADPALGGVDPGVNLVIIVASEGATIRMAGLLGPLVVVNEARCVHTEEATHRWLRHPCHDGA